LKKITFSFFAEVFLKIYVISYIFANNLRKDEAMKEENFHVHPIWKELINLAFKVLQKHNHLVTQPFLGWTAPFTSTSRRGRSIAIDPTHLSPQRD
jgi:hypothetical protein